MGQHDPKSERDLFDFYYKKVKLLYSEVQAGDKLPLEILHEIAAAFDHISRIHVGSDIEQENPSINIEKAYSHLKRSCLDIFKIKYRRTLKKVRVLRRSKWTSYLDNGKFNIKMEAAYGKIRNLASSARVHEAQDRDDHHIVEPQFGAWSEVYSECINFEKRFYNHKQRAWARRKSFKAQLCSMLISGFIGAAIGTILNHFFDIVQLVVSFF